MKLINWGKFWGNWDKLDYQKKIELKNVLSLMVEKKFKNLLKK